MYMCVCVYIIASSWGSFEPPELYMAPHHIYIYIEFKFN